MLLLPPAVRILLAAHPIDMRNSIVCLAGPEEPVEGGRVRGPPLRLRLEARGSGEDAHTFRTGELSAFVHSSTRSGETALSILSGRKGHLVVHGYTV